MKFRRRHFIQTFVLGILGLVVLDAYWLEKYFIEWNTFDISDRKKDKIKVIQLSDLHLYELKSFHKSIAKRINIELPDILFITGDAINRTRHIAPLNEFLGLFETKILKIAILGNKENPRRVDLNLLKDTYEKHNGILLINESFNFQGKGRKLNVLGIDDYIYGNPDFSKAAENIDTTIDTIVLNHCPIYKEEIDKSSISLKVKTKLILSGHTHGGQITFFGIPLFTPYGSGNYLKGWYNSGVSKMYVSKGIGTAVLPIRFGARAEAAIFYI